MTDIICGVLNFFRDLIANHFPSLSLESGTLSSIANGFDMVIQFVAQINFLIPLPTILIILSLVYGIKLAKFALFLVNWLIRRIADIIP